jgi:hypothetical protein
MGKQTGVAADEPFSNLQAITDCAWKPWESNIELKGFDILGI